MTVHRQRNRRSRRAGFTLIELMVALMIGAIILMALFTISGGTSRHFQEQQRIGNTQRSVRMAMDRLRRDVARAGFLHVPSNLAPNVRTCPTPATPRASIPAVWIDDNDAGGNAALDAINRSANNTSADRLRLIGNYTTGDGYLVRDHNSTGDLITLQTDWLAFRRAFVIQHSGLVDTARFQDVFRAGRMLHIESPNGQHFFVNIEGSTINGTGTIAQIRINPPIPPGNPCLTGLGTGGSVASPLSEVEYFIGSPDSVNSTVAPSNVAVTGANTLLLRHELNMADGSELAGTRRVVLEYAVDFNIDFLLDTNISAALPPNLVNQPGGVAEATVQGTPWQVRGITARIAARTPEQNPRFPWPSDVAAQTNRYQVDSTRPGAARIRRATAEIMMPNMVPR